MPCKDGMIAVATPEGPQIGSTAADGAPPADAEEAPSATIVELAPAEVPQAFSSALPATAPVNAMKAQRALLAGAGSMASLV